MASGQLAQPFLAVLDQCWRLGLYHHTLGNPGYAGPCSFSVHLHQAEQTGWVGIALSWQVAEMGNFNPRLFGRSQDDLVSSQTERLAVDGQGYGHTHTAPPKQSGQILITLGRNQVGNGGPGEVTALHHGPAGTDQIGADLLIPGHFSSLEQLLPQLLLIHSLCLTQGPQFGSLLGKAGDDLDKVRAFCNRGPVDEKAVLADADALQGLMNQGSRDQGMVVAINIMALTGMAAANKDRVRSVGQAFQGKGGIKPAGTHHPDDPQTGGILIAPYPG